MSIAPSSFSYGALPAEAAAVARSAASAIRNTVAQSTAAIGQYLNDARAALPHGTFTAWATAELRMSDRTCRNYMQAAAWLAGKPETISVLPPTILYALSAPSAPAEVVDSVVAEATAGAALDPDAIQAKLDQVRDREWETRRQQQRQPQLTRVEARAKAVVKQRREAARQAKAATEADAERAARRQKVQPLAEKLHQVAPELAEVLGNHMLMWELRDALLEMAGGGQ